jgi:hypothetical protein
MAIQLLSLPTLVGGVTAGYPQYVNSLKNKINELATAMNISFGAAWGWQPSQ